MTDGRRLATQAQEPSAAGLREKLETARSAIVELAEAVGSLDGTAGAALTGDEASVLAEVALETVSAERSLVASRTALVHVLGNVRPWADAGHRGPTAWLAHRTRRRFGRCRTEVSAAVAWTAAPVAARRFLAGEIGLDHLRSVQQAAVLDDGRWAADADDTLGRMAAELDHDHFGRAVEHWRAWAEPDRHLDASRAAERSRSFRLSPSIDGITFVAGQLSGIAAAEVRSELTRLGKVEFEADWAEAKARLGEEATGSDLRRTATQRRADALLEMARRSASTTKRGEPQPARLELLMSWHTFVAELALNAASPPRPTEPPSERPRPGHPDGPTKRVCETLDGQVIAPSTILERCLGEQVRRVVIGAAGNVLDVGRSRRLFTGVLREAVQIRDRHCIAPGCRVPADACEVDHHVPWDFGGSTKESNGDLSCRHHHPGSNDRRPEGFTETARAAPIHDQPGLPP